MRLRVFGGYAGLGGAEQAFLDAGDIVLRVDNNPLLKDVEKMTIAPLTLCQGEGTSWDVAIFGVPCTEFSMAYSSPRSINGRNGIIHFPDLTLLELAVRWIEEHKPTYWVIENVVGAVKYFRPYLGEPTQKIGPFVLWGNFPTLLDVDHPHSKYDNDSWSTDPLRANKRAKWPLWLSASLRDAILSQRRLTEWNTCN